jgi:hypothetical protein
MLQHLTDALADVDIQDGLARQVVAEVEELRAEIVDA